MELTGTNRSNPLEPQTKIKAWPENRRRAAASAKPRRQTRGITPRATSQRCRRRARPQDTSPVTFANSPGAPIPRRANPRGRQSPGAPIPGGRDSLVVTARGQTPDPIPNSAVKTLSADGTASKDAEEQVAARLSQPPTAPIPREPPPPPPRGESPVAHHRRQTRRPAGRRWSTATPRPPDQVRGRPGAQINRSARGGAAR